MAQPTQEDIETLRFMPDIGLGQGSTVETHKKLFFFSSDGGHVIVPTSGGAPAPAPRPSFFLST